MNNRYSYYEEEPKIQPRKLITNRNPLKFWILTILTLGIYAIVFYISLSFDIDKIASRHDGKKTMNYILAFLLSLFTFTIVMAVWHHMLCERIRDELDRRDIDYSFGPSTFWLWNYLGGLIIIGPFVYVYKLCKAMNLLCESYNNEL